MSTQRGFARVKQPHKMPSFGIEQWGRIWGTVRPMPAFRTVPVTFLSHSWGRLQEVEQTEEDPAWGWCGGEILLTGK